MLLTIGDLEPFAPNLPEDRAAAMIADANALAAVVAPCIVAGDFQYQDAARAILRAAVLRWIDQGSGAQPALVAGPFGRHRSRSLVGACSGRPRSPSFRGCVAAVVGRRSPSTRSRSVARFQEVKSPLFAQLRWGKVSPRPYLQNDEKRPLSHLSG